MFLFPLSSIMMLMGFVAILGGISINISGAYMIGVLLDFPLITAILTAVFIRNTPLAVFLTLLSVVLVVELMGLGQMYRVHAPIAYTFVCIFISRILSLIRKQPASDLIKDSKWLYKALNVPLLEWNWTERANKAVNKSTKVFDVITIMLLVLLILYSVEVAVITYSTLWLGYFTLYLSPILFLERFAKLTYSWKKNDGVSNLKDAAKQSLDVSKDKISSYQKDTKSWVKSGFDNENKE